LPLRGSEIARSRLATRVEARRAPVIYLHCNDLRSEHRLLGSRAPTTGSRLGLVPEGTTVAWPDTTFTGRHAGDELEQYLIQKPLTRVVVESRCAEAPREQRCVGETPPTVGFLQPSISVVATDESIAMT